MITLDFCPPGLRVFGSYLMAHKAYLKGEYEKGLGIVETVLSFEGETYLIPTIFIYLSGAMNAMSLNPIANENVADTLTTTEFTIAMLANRGWTNNEIADYMEMNVNTVKSHITGIFNKLGINSRKELNEYMLR